ncbi:MAG: hypothetical protein C0518_00435 [Opitutus sp.]|nr:hypothetical protein [Opitutus sp.]
MSEPVQIRQPSPRVLIALFVLILVGVLFTVTQRWNASILDRYESRQVQTALSVYWIKQSGFRMDYLTPLFGPPWSVPMEFPTYQWIVAALSNLTGLHLEQTGRLVSLLFFWAMLPAAYDLLGRAGLSPSRRLLALAFVLSSPIYLFYTRAMMIETTALCFSVWFLCLFCRGLEPENWRALSGAAACAVLAGLTKVTTFAVYCVPAAVIAVVAAWRAARAGLPLPAALVAARRRLAVAAVPMGLGLAAALWWTAHSDAIKLQNPFTTFLTSTELRQWNFGTAALRMEANFWKTIQDNVTRNVLSEGALAVALCLAAFATPLARRLALLGGLSFFAGPLVFANLYHVHDYYYTANALLLVGAGGLLIASAWDNPRLTRTARWTVLGAAMVFQYNAFDRGLHYHYWKEAPAAPELASAIRQITPPDGVLIISGIDWDPLIAYYSERRAFMIPHDRDDELGMFEEVLGRIPSEQIAGMVLVGDARKNRNLVRARISRLGLAPQPIASSDDADLYLPARAVAGASLKANARLTNQARTRISFGVAAAPTIPNAKEQDLAGMDLSMCSPAPLRARSRYSVGVIDVSGEKALGAHAPSEIFFRPPPAATRFIAVVGLTPISYGKPPPEGSDGVIVQVFLQQPDGIRRPLLRRTLNPSFIKADRGPQQIEFDNGEPFAGDLVFSIDPGREGNATYDQSYWGKIEIR